MTWNYHKVLFSEEGAQNENNARVLMMSNFFLRNIFFIPASAAVGTALGRLSAAGPEGRVPTNPDLSDVTMA